MKAKQLFYNGKIYTLDAKMPVVSSIAINGDTIVAIGNDELRFQFNDAAEKIDLQKKVVIPGMVDAHAHLQLYTQSMHNVNLTDTGSVHEAIERLKAYRDKNQGAEWIQGWGWRQDDWPDRAFPTTVMIDRVIPDIPVTLTARSGHATWSNSLALARANISRHTPDPSGGEIQRDSAGQPTGLLLDEAMKLVDDIIPPMPIPELAKKMENAIKTINEIGLIGFHDFDGPDSFQALQALKEQSKLSLRVVKHIRSSNLDDAIRLGLHTGFGDDFLRIGSIKIFVDGALGSRTAAMFDPYEGESGNRGIVVTDKEDLIQLARKASISGLNCAVHAIGDRAVHDVLDAYESVRLIEKEHGISVNERRHRIEHVQLIHPDDAARLGTLGIVASMQPTHATSDMYMADKHWGKRAANSYNWRLQLDHGATLAFGSDAPVESVNPFLGIHAAVTRRREDGTPDPMGWRPENNGRLTVQEALHAYTVGPSFAAGLDGRLGRLAPGYLADLLVLNQDLFIVDPMEIVDTKPLSVMIGGKWVVNNI
jgi:predicted amidohydrolase YtcJ